MDNALDSISCTSSWTLSYTHIPALLKISSAFQVLIIVLDVFAVSPFCDMCYTRLLCPYWMFVYLLLLGLAFEALYYLLLSVDTSAKSDCFVYVYCGLRPSRSARFCWGSPRCMFLRTLSQTFARQPFLSDRYISNFDIKLRMNYSRIELYDRQNMPWPSNLKQGMNVLDRYSVMSWWQAVDLAATSTLQYSSLLHYYFTPILARSR